MELVPGFVSFLRSSFPGFRPFPADPVLPCEGSGFGRAAAAFAFCAATLTCKADVGLVGIGG